MKPESIMLSSTINDSVALCSTESATRSSTTNNSLSFSITSSAVGPVPFDIIFSALDVTISAFGLSIATKNPNESRVLRGRSIKTETIIKTNKSTTIRGLFEVFGLPLSRPLKISTDASFTKAGETLLAPRE